MSIVEGLCEMYSDCGNRIGVVGAVEWLLEQ